MSEQTYELRFEYFNEENATLFFQKITDFLLSIDKLNNSLVSVFGIEIDINIQIKSIEKGSIRIWIAEKLNKISDDDIKHYISNPRELLADLLIKSKKMILEKIQDKKCQDIPKEYKNIIEKSDLKDFGYNNNETKSKVDINSIQRLIRNYKQDLECFGKLGFELQKIAKTNKKIYFLNEQQATLLLTYMKNSESVRNAKKVLVFAFYKMKEKLKNLEQEQEKARFKTLSDENQRLNSLNHHQKIGYKSQLAQQKEKYENKIKALKYDLDHKNELSFKRKLSQKELLELRKILARDYGMICIKEWEMSLFAEKIGKDTVFEAVLNKLEKELKYWKNYDEFEEKWKKILRK